MVTGHHIARSALFALLVGLSVAASGPFRDEAAAVRTMTFNIRYATDRDGEHAWRHRRDRVAALIQANTPDIFGLQEVLPDQLEFLNAHLTEYEFHAVGRDDGKTRGEASPVAWRKERFEELDRGTWWLSETPDVPGRGWDAALPRIATWVRLHDRATDQAFLAVSTHFDHRGEAARAEGAKLLVTLLHDESHVILLGDFNATPGSLPHETLTGVFADAAGDDHAPTWTGFDGEPDPGRRIDWILVRGFDVISYAVHAWSDLSQPESDHLPVFADIKQR